jgi:hypothetical protein
VCIASDFSFLVKASQLFLTLLFLTLRDNQPFLLLFGLRSVVGFLVKVLLFLAAALHSVGFL